MLGESRLHTFVNTGRLGSKSEPSCQRGTSVRKNSGSPGVTSMSPAWPTDVFVTGRSRGEGDHEKTPCIPLNYSANLKLLQKIRGLGF